MDPTFCIGNLYCGMTIAHILLWVLTFAVTYGILGVLNVFGKKNKVNVMVALVLASFVLISAPVAVISVIANMSNSLVTLAIGVTVLMALLTMASYGDKEKGAANYWTSNAKAIAIIIALIAIAVFVGAGGLPLIGISSLQSIGFVLGPEMWIIALVVIAVVYLSSGKEA